MNRSHSLPLFRVLIVLLGLTLIEQRGLGSTFTVSTFVDENTPSDSTLSLRDAIIAANGNSGHDIILLPAGTFTLTLAGQGEDTAATGDLDITESVTLIGAGEHVTILDAITLGDRVFHVRGGPVNISSCWVRSGETPGMGGGILNEAGLILDHVRVTGCFASTGGGIHNMGQLDMEQAVLSENTAWQAGGGLFSVATVNLKRSTVSLNSASSGGGVFAGGETSVEASTLNGNTALQLSPPSESVIYTGTETTTATIAPGTYNSFANNLDHFVGTIVNNTVAELIPSPPDGTTVYKYDNEAGHYVINTFDGLNGSWSIPEMTLKPGEGAFIRNPSGSPFNVVITGRKRSSALVTARVAGLHLIGSQTLPSPSGSDFEDVFGFSPLPGDVVTQVNNTFSPVGGPGMASTTHTFGPEGWDSKPTFARGRAAFVNLAAPLDRGGALFVAGGTCQIINSTISGNSSDTAGGGLATASGFAPSVSIESSTFADNSAGGASGIERNAGTIALKNTIVSRGITGSNFAGSVVSNGHNLSSDATGPSTATDLLSTDPLLGSLQFNGGPTLTHALLPGSPAIDSGASANPLPTDQRGYPRVSDGNGDSAATIDRGAVEGVVYLVVNTTDSGAGSLRQAILDANATPGHGTIVFDIPGLGLHIIRPSSALPTVTEAVFIDGYTQAGAAVNTLSSGCNAVLRIELDGSLAGADVTALVIIAGNSTVRGLVINRFSGSGILLGANGGNRIEGNFIGTDVTGSVDLGNAQDGIRIDTLSGNIIGGPTAAARNVISGNGQQGIDIFNSTGNVIQGNYIGTDAAGTAVLGNALDGVILSWASGNTIGGTDTLAGNVLSGNGARGLFILGSGAADNRVFGNLIGTDRTGTIAVPNSLDGILISEAPGNQIGGSTVAARNVISGNALAGVQIIGAAAELNVIRGNFIGTDVNGVTGIANPDGGIAIVNAPRNTVGGIQTGERNIISGNGTHGIDLRGESTSGTVVLGNYIGTDVTGGAAVRNGTGIRLIGARGNTIGGLVEGARNLISGNSVGVLFQFNADNNEVLGNFIGTDATGKTRLPNTLAGIYLNEVSRDNVIGGTLSMGGNLISGNALGVLIDGGSVRNRVQGNLIGTDVTGTESVGNTGEGVFISVGGANNIIGGSGPGEGNIISGNTGVGVHLIFGARLNQILGNLIGPDVTGTVALGNAGGVLIQEGSENNLVGGTSVGTRNVISGNFGHGIVINDHSPANQVSGNYVGTTGTGEAPLPNGANGIMIRSDGNQIGGTEPGAGNVISANLACGVRVGAVGNLIAGNLIGLNAAGTVAMGNGSEGVKIDHGSLTVVGGADARARNVISANSRYGIEIAGNGADGNRIQGNYVGTDSNGTYALANGGAGVMVGYGRANVIGGSGVGDGNLVSGNDVGIDLRSRDNVVQGNRVGTDITGIFALPNGTGIYLADDAKNNRIGGTEPGERNLISGNQRAISILGVNATGNIVQGNFIGTDASGQGALSNFEGIVIGEGASQNQIGGVPGGNVIAYSILAGVTIAEASGNGVDSVQNSIRGNSIHSNLALGVDLARPGEWLTATANDPDDLDSGANNLQNFPEITRLVQGGGMVIVDYSISSATANSDYPLKVDFYLADSSQRQGKTLLFTDTYTAQDASRSKRVIFAASLNASDALVATATDFKGNTSEFSLGTAIQNSAPALDLTFSQRTVFAGSPDGRRSLVTIEDLDDDTKADIIVDNGDAGTVSIYRNQATAGILNGSSLAGPVEFAGGGRVSDIITADIDNDTKPDLVIANGTLGTVSILRNISAVGAVSFSERIELGVGGECTAVAAADLDGDGLVELIAANRSANSISVFRNSSSAGNIMFLAPASIATELNPIQVAVSDADRDGKLDILVLNAGSGSISVCRNRSALGVVDVASAVNIAVGVAPRSFSMGDLNRDTKPEFAVGLSDGSVVVLRNRTIPGEVSAGSFETVALIASGSAVGRVIIGEVDGDFRPDLVVSNPLAERINFYSNTSDEAGIKLEPFGTLQGNAQPISVALADLDGGMDSRPDVVAVNHLDGSLVLWLNTASQIVPVSSGTVSIPFTVADFESGGSGLTITAESSNPGLLPNSNLGIIGSGPVRMLEVHPLPTVTGIVTVTVTVQDPGGARTINRVVLAVGCLGNTLWPNACSLDFLETSSGMQSAVIHQSLDQQDETRWFKFPVQPQNKLLVTLTQLPADYDLFVFTDIQATYDSILEPTLDDLVRLGAEFAPTAFSPTAFSDNAFAPTAFSPTAFSPTAFSPTAFSPTAFSPTAFSPTAFSPTAFSPTAFSPTAFSPTAFSPTAFSPTAFSPTAFSPTAFSPTAFSPTAFSPTAFSPTAFSPTAFSGAQSRSLIGVSAFSGNASEGIMLNTWNNTGNFYIAVRGRNGAFAANQLFRLEVAQLSGACQEINPLLPGPTLTAQAGAYRTLILTDPNRMSARLNQQLNPANNPERLAQVREDVRITQEKLAQLALRPEVRGVVIDVGADGAVNFANGQADQYIDCIFAKNMVATAIKNVIDLYRSSNGELEYIVLVGNDDIIPYFRTPDTAGLGNEKNYIPPVRDHTASQSSLRHGQVLSQDGYGAVCGVTINGSAFPIPDLAVGRLVETPGEIGASVDLYLATPEGVISQPRSSLVTGYDFLVDAAREIHAELRSSIGVSNGQVHETLLAVDPEDPTKVLAPMDSRSWTAVALRQALLGSRHDVIFLAGHFNAGSALAADWTTELTAAEVAASTADLKGAIIFGNGCHVGYNIVDWHGIENVTSEPDWAQAFALKQTAAFIGGTGYQYGDTDFVEYNERLYVEFTRQLRAGIGARSIGKALLAAKRAYLKNTPIPQEIHEKSVLQTTLFGLPMFRVNLPENRGVLSEEESVVPPLTAFGVDPGETLGLRFADVAFESDDLGLQLQQRNVTFYPEAPQLPYAGVATYLSGADGQFSNPLEPVLPLVRLNVSVEGTVLRGVGFRGGMYSDEADVLALTGAPATEIRGVSVPFQTSVFYPVRPWNVNYYGAVCEGDGGSTRLMLFPSQYISAAPASITGTRRAFSSMNFRLYYSANTATYGGGSIPALSEAPTISSVGAAVLPGGDSVKFSVVAVGNPAAGIQEVWVTYTELAGAVSQWTSMDLVQNPLDSRVWEGILTKVLPGQVRFMVQAVNGVGLVTLDTQRGAFYAPSANPETQPLPLTAVTLTLEDTPVQAAYGDTFAVTGLLKADGVPLAGRAIEFVIDSQRGMGVTGSDGRASAVIRLLAIPGDYKLTGTFLGNATESAASAEKMLRVAKQGTAIHLEVISPAPNLNIQSTLTDSRGTPLDSRSVFFVLLDGNNQVQHAESVITDFAGRARLGAIPLPPATYHVVCFFNGIVPLDGSLSVPAMFTALVDERYEPSHAISTFTYAAQTATVEYTGDFSPSTDGTLHLSALVTAPGDLTLGYVAYEIFDASGAPMASVIAVVAADGVSVASVSGLPEGSYQVRVQVIGGSYASPAQTVSIGNRALREVARLGELLRSLGLTPALVNSLTPKLDNASRALSDGKPSVACNALRAFINEVKAHRTKRLTASQADSLTAAAARISVMLGCPN